MAGTTLDKSVSLRIVANAGTAKETLDNIAARADDINGKKSSLTVGVHSGDTKAQLDEITARAHALGIMNVKFSVKADTKTADKNIDESTNKLKSLAVSFGHAGSSAIGFGDMMTVASGDSSMFQKVMAGVNLATGLLEPALAGGIVAVGGLASGLAAAGAGLGVFGLVAKANYTTASTAAKSVQTAQDTYNASIAAGVSKSKAYQAEQAAIGKAYASLSPAQIQLSKQITNTQNAWQSFVQSNTSGVSKVMTQGFGLLPKLFASMQPFMAPVEKALSGLITQLGHGLDSSGFKSFIHMLASNSGPAITKLAQSIGHIVVGIGGILKAFMPMSQTMLSGLDSITAKFAKWGETINGHTGFQSLMSMAKTEAPMAMTVLKNLATVIVNVGKAMTGLDGAGNSKTLLQTLIPLSSILASLSKNQDLDRIALYLLAANSAGGKLSKTFQSLFGDDGLVKKAKGIADGTKNLVSGFRDADTAASSASGVMGTFGGSLSKAVTGIKEWGIWSKIASGATKVWTGIQAAFDVVMDANPITLVVIAIVALIAIIVVCTIKFKVFRDFWKDAWSDIKNWTSNVISFLHSDWSAFINSFVSFGHTMESAWNSTIGYLHSDWSSFINTFVKAGHAIEAAFDTVVKFIKQNWILLLGFMLGPIALTVAAIIRFWPQISAAFVVAGKAIESAWNSTVSFLKNTATTVINAIVGFFRAAPGRISSAFSSLPGLLTSVGRNAIQGLWNGISSMISFVVGKVEDFASKISGAFSKVLGIFSPSRVFTDHGKNIALGLVQGITGSNGLVESAAAGLGTSVSKGFSVPASRTSGLNRATGGNTFNITVSGVVGDAGATGKQIVQTINTYLRQTGQGNLASA